MSRRSPRYFRSAAVITVRRNRISFPCPNTENDGKDTDCNADAADQDADPYRQPGRQQQYRSAGQCGCAQQDEKQLDTIQEKITPDQLPEGGVRLPVLPDRAHFQDHLSRRTPGGGAGENEIKQDHYAESRQDNKQLPYFQ